MKIFNRICGAICFACWAFLCVSAATGTMTVDTIDYCLAAGLLAFQALFVIIRGY